MHLKIIPSVILKLNSEFKEMMNDYQTLKEQKLCKICLDEDVGVLFEPCGHLCCCASCAAPLKQCPICRQQIKKSIRAFIPWTHQWMDVSCTILAPLLHWACYIFKVMLAHCNNPNHQKYTLYNQKKGMEWKARSILCMPFIFYILKLIREFYLAITYWKSVIYRYYNLALVHTPLCGYTVHVVHPVA